MKKYFALLLPSILFFSVNSFAQNQVEVPTELPASVNKFADKTVADNEKSAQNPQLQDKEIARERREQAYAKLLEGQRFLWNIKTGRLRSRLSIQTGAKLAKDALQKAVELEPTLAEGYTALAEIALRVPPQNIDDAIRFSEIAVKLDKDNFGGYRYLGRLYTIKSNLGRGRLNPNESAKAIAAWKEVTRLDPRYAEGWAFLSAFYSDLGQTDEQIITLRNWLSSSTPLEAGFYTNVMLNDGELTNETAALKLGQVLLETGENEEALSILARAVSDSPENSAAIALLSEAIENSDSTSLKQATEALRQAVFANPDNESLNQLLAQTLVKSGNLDDAVKVLKLAAQQKQTPDENNSSGLQIALGDIYTEAGRYKEAILSYEEALQNQGITTSNEIATDDDRDFALLVIGKMIRTYKEADQLNDAKFLIEKSRVLFGKDDSPLDREYISILRENGDNEQALKAIQSARAKSPFDYNLIRTEASILTDLGKVEEGVKLINNLIDQKPANSTASIMYDDFVNYLYISSLYMEAGRGEQAVANAEKAFQTARGNERKQIARLTIASAQQNSGNFNEAETILKEILEQTPDNPIALNNLGYLYLESEKNFEQARDLIEKAVKIDPRNPSYLDSLGWAFYKLKNYEQAEKYLERAARYDTTSATIYEHLGDVYDKNGKAEKAQTAWKKALKLASNQEEKTRISGKLKM